MKSKKSKVLHPLAGKPMVRHVLDAVREAKVGRTILVVGYEADQVRRELGKNAEYAEQREQLGTGHAVLQAIDLIGAEVATALVLCGDTPLIRAETLRRLLALHHEAGATITMLTASIADPTGYGRVVRENGRVKAIVEERSTTPEERAIREINSGIYCFDAAWLHAYLPRIEKNSKGEYYLTDLVAMATAEDRVVAASPVEDASEVMGVNDRSQLAEADEILRWRIRRRLMLAGVTLVAPALTFVDDGVTVGADTTIYPNTFLLGNTSIGGDCWIGPNCYIVNSSVGANCKIFASVIEDSRVDSGAHVGPYSHLRAGAHVGATVNIGNFAEIKNSSLGAGTQVHHFSYLGDATVGQRVNVAAGTITCNFNSETGAKSATIIEDDAALGSDTMLVAPVKVEKGAMTGAGTVVINDIPADSMAIGVPARVVRKVKRS